MNDNDDNLSIMNDNKTIAINTVVLTIKLVITLLCNFIVSRLILQALGADDYGLYNVVGGIVDILALLSTSMVATSYRYIAVEIGKGDKGEPQKVYSTLFLIHILLGFLLILIGLPVGSYYINNFLTVTNASIADAQFVFVFSLISAFFTVIAVPSNGLLIAHENFITISIIEIIRSVFNIVIAIILLRYFGNRLRLYAVLIAALNIGNRLAFHYYCKYKYASIVKYSFNRNIHDYKEIASFTGWILLGATAVVGKTQGVSMVINLFFRNSINAAFGIANQIGNAANMFTNTLRQSVTPQIMKNQVENSSRSIKLVYGISRYTFLIMLVICVPLLLSIDTVLRFWLGNDNIPPFTKSFAIYILISGMITNLSSGFDASIQASGNVRKNQIGYTIINLSIIPIVYFLYKLGFPVYTNAIIGVVLSVVTLLFQAYIMKGLTVFTYSEYLKKTILPSLITTVVAFLPMILLHIVINDGLTGDLFFIMVSFLWSGCSVFLFGINSREREALLQYIRKQRK